MSNQNPSFVAIIGAGLSGLALALSLSQQGIPSIIYESRAAPLNIGGAIMLSPNALRILDNLGIYTKIQAQGYNFAISDWYDSASNSVTERYEFGGRDKYDYDALRVYRHVLIDVLLEACKEAGVCVEYGKKFLRVLAETEESVTWEWADGSTGEAALLVGADGIHSSVRKYLYPDLAPKFTGMAGITAAVPTSQLGTAGGKFSHPVTYTHPSAGAFVIAPQEPDGSEVLIGKQRRMERELSRAEWDDLSADKEGLVRFLQANNDMFPDITRNAASNVPHGKLNVWPFYVIPKLESWASERKRVLILGDAAHAIPPSAGQGINQAFEDVYMLSMLLSATADQAGWSSEGLKDALVFWQTFRQERVEKVLALNKQIDLRRLPAGSVEGVKREAFELGWLYNADLEAVVKDSLKGKVLDEGTVQEFAQVKARECPVVKIMNTFHGGH